MGNRITALTKPNFNKLNKLNKLNKVNKVGRWIYKDNKQIDISSYWSNIDHCGDKVCGNLKETKSFYEKEVLKINNKIERQLSDKR
jgi:hypothetical protein|tara:strand:- start:248 stop:505 length:258 start_codon:yes stop_codon:yes gene_type:complete